MKIYSISDLHLSVKDEKPMDIFGKNWTGYLEKIKEDWLAKVSQDDVVLLCGDLSWAMKLEDTDSAMQLLASLPGKKIIIRGNHDYWWKSISSLRAILPQGCYALQNDSLKIENVVFCGSRGWSAEENKPLSQEDKKIFDREVLRMEMSLEDAARRRDDGDKLVVLIHYPPFNSQKENSKFTDLFEKYNVDCVVYGHLHGKNIYKNLFCRKNNVSYYLTSCDQVNNNLVEISFEN